MDGSTNETLASTDSGFMVRDLIKEGGEAGMIENTISTPAEAAANL